ncbi:hypothetical protein HMSSN036_35580 [Paenibacillus macerans]|nr:hypothetical protein HMSSN036_35580 [Paenibacillus macerans]
MLLTIDVAYTRENFESSVPFLTFDQEMAAKSITRMQELIEDVRPSYVFLGHDRDQAQTCRTFPDFL